MCDNVTKINGLYNDKKTFSEIFNEFFMSEKMKKYLTIIFFAIFVYQFLYICYVNLFQFDLHMGYDASSVYLQAETMIENKRFTPVNISTLLAAPIYYITGNICFSFGIVNIVLTSIIVVIFYFISVDLGVDRLATIISSCLLLTPYIGLGYNTSNPLGYFSCVFFSASFYSGLVIAVLLSFMVLIKLNNDHCSNKDKVLACVSILVLFLTSLTLGYSNLVFIIFPAVLMVIFDICNKKDISFLFNKKTAWILCAAVTVILGKLTATYFFSVTSLESGMTLIGMSDLWDNIISVFIGFASLLGTFSLYSNVPVFSVTGINILINLIILIFVSISIIVFYAKFILKKKLRQNSPFNFIACFCFVNFFIYMILNSRYGAPIFEERYLIQFFIFSLFMVGLFLNHNYDRSFLKRLITIGLIPVILTTNIISFISMNTGKNFAYRDLCDIISKYDAKVVCAYDMEGSDMSIYIRNMRTLDRSRVYKYVYNGQVDYSIDYSINSSYYDDASSYDKMILLVRDSQVELLPEYIKNSMVYKETYEKAYNGIHVYEADNVLDFQTGLSDDFSIDFPYSSGVITSNCTINENGHYVTDGTAGYLMYGPYYPTYAGKYRFTLHYNIISSINEIPASFDISVNLGNEILDYAALDSSAGRVSLEVEFDGDEIFEYRLYNSEGSNIELLYIEMERITD